MDVPLKPDTPWGTEVRTLMCEQDLGFDDAFARVMEKYFRTGEIGPLADLLIRGRVEVGEPAIRFLAATLNPVNSDSTVLNIRYRFGFTATRRRGRPKKDDDEAAPRTLALAVLQAGAAAMAAGHKPNKLFWKYLAAALNENAHWAPRTDFPLKAKLFPIRGRKGRKEKAELEIRSRVLASRVQALVDRGDGYDAAVTLTHEELIKTGKAEAWCGRIGRKTVRDAYDAHAKANRKK
jgi:hypothetical protein